MYCNSPSADDDVAKNNLKGIQSVMNTYWHSNNSCKYNGFPENLHAKDSADSKVIYGMVNAFQWPDCEMELKELFSFVNFERLLLLLYWR